MRKNFNIFKGIIFVLFIIYIFIKFIIQNLTNVDQFKFLFITVSIILSLYIIYKVISYIFIKKADINYVRDIPNKYSIPVVSIYIIKK